LGNHIRPVVRLELGCRGDVWQSEQQPSSLLVCPSDDNIARIRSDYRDMREMFFAEPPPFESLMAELRELEERVSG
jgi:hypothetical protein